MVVAGLILFATLFVGTQSFIRNDYKPGKVYHGRATFYAGGANYDSGTGNCAIKGPLPKPCYKGRIPVAINAAQYKDACGACIDITAKGKGIGATPLRGKLYGFISDRCHECGHSNLDLAMYGDGIWEISWKVVPCTPAPRLELLFEGSNPWYWKVQPRGMNSPPTQVVIDGKICDWKQDNHWVCFMNGKPGYKTVKVTNVLGQVFYSKIKNFDGNYQGIKLGSVI